MHWQPSQPNGWWPRLSWPWVCYGNAATFVANLETGEERQVTPIGWHSGWYGPETIQWIEWQSDVTATMWRASAPDWTPKQIAVDPALVAGNWHAASRGHFASVLATRPSRCQYDGVVVPGEYGNGLALDGEYMAVALDYTLQRLGLFRGGALVREMTPSVVAANKWTVTAPGWCGYGYWGRAGLWTPDGLDLDVTVTPDAREGPPLVRDLDGVPWLWSPIGYGDQDCGVAGRPLGETDCLVVPWASVAIDVQRVGDEWVVAGCNDKGRLSVESVRVDAPRHPLPASPTVVLPPVPDLTGRPLWLGYFFAISDRPGYGDNPDAPGNCTLVTTEAEAARSPWPYFAPPGVAEGPRKIAAWNSVPPESSACAGLVILDTGHESPAAPVAGARWQGVECYAHWSSESAENCYRRVAAWLDRWRVPVILIGQAYTRNGLETDTQKLADLQAVPLRLAREFPCVEGVVYFSDGRPTGTRDNEWWRPVHTAAAAMVVAPSPSPVPPEPPHPPEPPMNWRLTDLLVAYDSRFPCPMAPGADYRAWTQRFAEQAAFSADRRYGAKSQSPTHPQSQDVVAYRDDDGHLWGWDIIIGAGGPNPRVEFNPGTMDITGQYFIPVVPVDHLGSGPTPPTPPTPPIPPIPPTDTLVSIDGRFRLAMQSDGNLVVYQGDEAIWASGSGPR